MANRQVICGPDAQPGETNHHCMPGGPVRTAEVRPLVMGLAMALPMMRSRLRWVTGNVPRRARCQPRRRSARETSEQPTLRGPRPRAVDPGKAWARELWGEGNPLQPCADLDCVRKYVGRKVLRFRPADARRAGQPMTDRHSFRQLRKADTPKGAVHLRRNHAFSACSSR